ncbi:hypothetical protein [Sulfuriflexus mobilis]|uniref:hypothetical protein n=1 Tax=Sulfuriflexus mobilis TaxID=1811807 RepID=UPI000F81D40C|nr:hypothetical protein [Sulfuriflexus mobilis]
MDNNQEVQEKINKYYANNKWTVKHWIALILFISGFACIAYFGNSDNNIIKKYTGAYFGLSIALSLIFWGLINLERGYITGRRKRYYRKKSPNMFIFLFLFEVALPAIGMLFVSLVFVLPLK